MADEPYTANLDQMMIGAAHALADSLVQVLLSLTVSIIPRVRGSISPQMSSRQSWQRCAPAGSGG